MLDSYFAPWAPQTRVPALQAATHASLTRLLDLPRDASPATVYNALDTAPNRDEIERTAAEEADELATILKDKPKDYQQPTFDLLSDFDVNTLTHYADWGSRGGGKSWKIARFITTLSSTTKRRVACVREATVRLRESSKELLEKMITDSTYRNDWQFTEFELRNKRTGSVILFLGLSAAHADSIARSLEGVDLVWCEEAAQLSEAAINALLPAIRVSKPNPIILWSWNPPEQPSYVDRMFRLANKPPPRSRVVSTLVEDNPWMFCGRLEEELRASYRRDSTARFKNIWRGFYLEADSATVLPRVITGCLDFEALPDPSVAVPFCGVDFGNGRDPYAIVAGWQIAPEHLPASEDNPDRRAIIYVTHSRKLHGNVSWFELGENVTEIWNYVRSENVITDHSPDRRDYLRSVGLPAVHADKRSVADGFDRLGACIILVHPTCDQFATAARALRWKTDPKTGNIIYPLQIGPGSDDHECDACRYGTGAISPGDRPTGGVTFHTPIRH